MTMPRILIFIHDGRGLGHLRRLSILAQRLQGAASVLFLTGLREASWIVPPNCEFIHIPNIDSLESDRSQQWLRDPFLPEGSRHSATIRPRLIRATVEAFEPDALIVDYLPLGRGEELHDIVFGRPECKKYYISRGVLGKPEEVRKDVFTPTCLEALRTKFCRILVMSDPCMVDTVQEYGFDPILASKVTYAGYAVNQPTQAQLQAARRARGISSRDRWVVCSAGGGKSGEQLVQRCWELSRLFPEAYFDIVAGPRARLKLQELDQKSSNRVIVVDANTTNLPIMHAAADVVITRAGYNSLLEASVGAAHIIAVPIPWDYEQQDHVRRLANHRLLHIVEDIDEIDVVLERVINLDSPAPLTSTKIGLTGADIAAHVILQDLLRHPNATNNPTNVPDWSYA
jgi:predicted glycosyltransferase